MSKHIEFASPILPRDGDIDVLTPTTSSQEQDLTALANCGPDIVGGRAIRMTADGGDVYVNLGSVAAGSVDSTSVAGLTQGQMIAAGDFMEGFLPYVDLGTGATGQGAARYLRYRTTAPGTVRLRISIVSEELGQRQH